jgi:hypothetical protein
VRLISFEWPLGPGVEEPTLRAMPIRFGVLLPSSKSIRHGSDSSRASNYAPNCSALFADVRWCSLMCMVVLYSNSKLHGSLPDRCQPPRSLSLRGLSVERHRARAERANQVLARHPWAIRLRQLQTSAPDKQPDHQPRGGNRGPEDIDDDRLGARTVRPSGGRRDVRAGHQLSRRGPSGGLKASARPPCRPAGRRGPPLLPRRRPLPLPSSPSAASAIAPPAHPRRTPQALRRSRLP